MSSGGVVSVAGVALLADVAIDILRGSVSFRRHSHFWEFRSPRLPVSPYFEVCFQRLVRFHADLDVLILSVLLVESDPLHVSASISSHLVLAGFSWAVCSAGDSPSPQCSLLPLLAVVLSDYVFLQFRTIHASTLRLASATRTLSSVTRLPRALRQHAGVAAHLEEGDTARATFHNAASPATCCRGRVRRRLSLG